MQPAPTGVGATPLIVDTDLSVDDIIALAYVLRQPGLDVRAITVSGTGLVRCLPGVRVARSIAVAMAATEVQIGCGRDSAGELAHPFPGSWRDAADSGYSIDFPMIRVGELGPTTDAPTLISELVTSSRSPVTILSLGPMTNIADALAMDDVAPSLERIVAMAGAVNVTGNVMGEDGAALPAEWNLYADPESAGRVLDSHVPITLIPLDATQYVPVTQAFVDELAGDHGAAGADISYELFARYGIRPSDYLWDPLAAVTLVKPDVVTTERMRLVVDDESPTATGALLVDSTGGEVEVATTADADAFTGELLAGLRIGAQRAEPFDLQGTIPVVYDGAACESSTADIPAGKWTFSVQSTAEIPVLFALVTLHEGWTWDDLAHYVEVAPNPGQAPPFTDVVATLSLDQPGSASTIVDLRGGTHALACAALDGEDVLVDLTDGPLSASD